MYNLIKKLFDFFFSLFLFSILLPLILIISLFILFDIGRPIFFLQERTGKNGKVFKIIKFRTMNDNVDINGNVDNDKSRISFTGKYLRKFSLDELPTLLNIINGDMSFVGPRPLLHEYYTDNLYSDVQKERFNVKTGITGFAQINGRNKLTWEEKFNLDIWYVRNRSFWLDIKIVLKTIIKIFDNRDVDSDNDDTMKKFTGS
ncbi:MAG: hypothetical protein CMD73_01320 [Gammaproteobacteria bacterium]|nr:hypothetical protein [Gammaproteobacteria bacterium]